MRKSLVLLMSLGLLGSCIAAERSHKINLKRKIEMHVNKTSPRREYGWMSEVKDAVEEAANNLRTIAGQNTRIGFKKGRVGVEYRPDIFFEENRRDGLVFNIYGGMHRNLNRKGYYVKIKFKIPF